MSDMVEKVARAICVASSQCKYMGKKCNTGRCAVGPEIARAAIKAMQKPSKEMWNAAYHSSYRHADPNSRRTAFDIWGGMIEIALGEQE